MDEIKILILGGYGVFGGRLAKLLADEERLTIVIAGRSIGKAEDFCRNLPSKAQLLPELFDRNSDIELQLGKINPDIVVDASGPFQNYGNDPYGVVKACIKLQINYMDLADSSDFVGHINQFDKDAKERNIFILSGVSSFPVLTVAVIRKLSQGLDHIKSVKAGIAPSPYAGVGLNVIKAIANYSGKPISLVRGGKKAIGYGMAESMRYTISPSGKKPLHNIRFSLVDVPDLQVIPKLWTELDEVWVGAGPVPEILHRMLNGLAWLVKMRVLPSLSPFAELFYFVINTVRWGEHRGGMFVSVNGITKDGKKKEHSWHLLAEGDDGPFIPSMGIEIIVRNILENKVPESGARPATGDIELEDYDKLFKCRTIYTGFRDMDSLSDNAPLYQRLMGDSWGQLPEAIRALHDLKDEMVAEGLSSVERGKGLLSRLIAKCVGFPEEGKNVPLKVSFKKLGGEEIWTRNFAGKTFVSRQSEGTGKYERLLYEKFSPMHFGLALVLDDKKLYLTLRKWNFLGIPMPLFLAPQGDAYEYEENGRFNFNVRIYHPFIGLIVHYRGWLVPNRQK